MFRDYPYLTGTSTTMTGHFTEYAREVRAALPERGLIVEIGSNDGTFLRAAQSPGVTTVGVEPARNVAAIARERGVTTIAEFFSPTLAREIAAEWGKADAIVANNVVAHVHDLRGLVEGVVSLLADRGTFVAEFPYVIDLLDGAEYDTIYHEHLSYFSVTAIAWLFARSGLKLYRVKRVAVHGGSLRVYGSLRHDVEPSIEEHLARERSLLVPTAFARFSGRVRRQRSLLREMVGSLGAGGKRVAAYGAAAKGNTLLNYCELDDRQIAYVVDRNPLKQGYLTPGTHIPVVSPERLENDRPDHVLVLPWNLADEIIEQLRDLAGTGTRFIIPIPDPVIR
jgi:SAM-dependent methyltransferase